MALRQHDPAFAREEKLWRRIRTNDMKRGRVNPASLRLQVSVIRERHGTTADVPDEHGKGIAECTAEVISAVSVGCVRVVCVDDPKEPKPGHALLAVVMAPGDQAPANCLNAIRQTMAAAMTVIDPP